MNLGWLCFIIAAIIQLSIGNSWAQSVPISPKEEYWQLLDYQRITSQSSLTATNDAERFILYYSGNDSAKELLDPFYASLQKLSTENRPKPDLLVTILQTLENEQIDARLRWLGLHVISKHLSDTQWYAPGEIKQQIRSLFKETPILKPKELDLYLRVGAWMHYARWLFYTYNDINFSYDYLVVALQELNEISQSTYLDSFERILQSLIDVNIERRNVVLARATAKVQQSYQIKHDKTAASSNPYSLGLDADFSRIYALRLNTDSSSYYAHKVAEAVNQQPQLKTTAAYLEAQKTQIRPSTDHLAFGSSSLKADVNFVQTFTFKGPKNYLKKQLDYALEVLAASIQSGEYMLASLIIDKIEPEITQLNLQSETDAALKARFLYKKILLGRFIDQKIWIDESATELEQLSLGFERKLLEPMLSFSMQQIIQYYLLSELELTKLRHKDAQPLNAVNIGQLAIKEHFNFRTKALYPENLLYAAHHNRFLFRALSELSYELHLLSNREQEAKQWLANSFVYADMNRAQLLTEQLLQHNALNKVPIEQRAAFYQTDINAELLRREFEHTNSIDLTPRFYELQSERRQLVNAFEQKMPGWNNLWQQPEVYIKEVQQALSDRQSLLLYSSLDGMGRLYVLEKNRIRSVDLLYREDISQLTLQLNQALLDKRDADIDRISSYLASVLLHALPQDLKEEIILITDMDIDRVPFSMLKTKNGSFFGEAYRLLKSPSARYFATPKVNRPVSEKRISAFSPVVFTQKDYNLTAAGKGLSRSGEVSLPYTKIEIDNIARIFSDQSNSWNPFSASYEFDAFTLEEASLSHFGSEQSLYSEMLHIASHSITDINSPERSQILFRKTENNSTESLFIRDIYFMNFHTNHLVLNGCETGTGKALSGEGIVGMTHAFHTAGVNHIIATLWPIDDRAASLMMSYYYQNVFKLASTLKEEWLYAEALRMAAQDLRKNYPEYDHPSYWASFYLSTANQE